MPEGPHPFPSRTRKLNPPGPMVLRWQRRGRVGRCRGKSHRGGRLAARDTPPAARVARTRELSRTGGECGPEGEREAGRGPQDRDRREEPVERRRAAIL